MPLGNHFLSSIFANMEFEKQITDIFFDLDHTLWDFEKNSALTFNKILAEQNIPIALESFLEVYVPINFAYWKLYREEKISKENLRYQRLKTTFDKLQVSISDAVIDRLSEDYIRYLPHFNHLFDGARSTLEYLMPKYNLHIITNGFREVQGLKMKASNIVHYFDHIIDSESVGVKKPNPLIFKHALELAKVPAANCLMIGDSLEADVIGAKEMGIQPIHFIAHGEPHHDHAPIITELSTLTQWL